MPTKPLCQAAPARDAPLGLTTQEAGRRRARVGANEPTRAHRRPMLLELLQFAANPLVVVLLVAALVAAVLGQIVDAVIIATTVLLSIALNFLQTYRSQRAAMRLQEQLAPQATVQRDGVWVDIPRRDVVPGDLVQLVAGDLVPADAQLLQAQDLHVQQAALTGESLPVEKQLAVDRSAATLPPLTERSDVVLLGTSVVSGTALATVLATGTSTVFGGIAARLADRAPESEFERGARQFGVLIARTVAFLVLSVFLVTAALRHDPWQSLLFALALAVGLTPEFLPMITTVTLGRAAVHMARRHVIVKNLAAIQNFGSIDVLCSDKTGTLTTGQMVLERHCDPFGDDAPVVLALAYLSSLHESGVKDPIRRALLERGAALGLDATALGSQAPSLAAYQKQDEVPFDFERRRTAIVVAAAAHRLMIVKGAPENVLAACSSYAAAGRTAPLDAAARSQCDRTFRELSAAGFRVLAVAHRTPGEQMVEHAVDEQDLVLAGFIAFADPPRPDVAAVVQDLRRAHVDVKILTGDNELVARHVCAQVGLDARAMVLGKDVDRLGHLALGHVAERTTIFARMTPAQKSRVLLALKSRGHVVGFLGDGINDAASLHIADVGISVATAVDVAKDAADIVLMEHSLRVLHDGIIEGRKAFGNIVKYLLMGTSSNFGNMFSMAAASLFLPFLPMLPTQILLNNFLYDLAQVAIPSDHVDPEFIRKPRRWDLRLIRDFMLVIGPISSLFDFMTFAVLIHVFRASAPLFHTGWFVESLATQTLVLFVIRTARNPLESRPSAPLALTICATLLAGLLIPFSPLAATLGFTPLPPAYFVFLLGAASTYLGLVQVLKRRLMARLLP
ncbi:MAG: magnesium-translocating P-type ATPase [Planctomycetota bacterium]